MRFDPTEPGTWARVDYDILNSGGVCLYKRVDLLENDIAELIAVEYRVFEFECTEWLNDEVMHGQFAERLGFPGYYGKNLDALSDCLRDYPFFDNEAVALVFRRFDHLVQREPSLAVTLLHIVASAEWTFLLTGRRLVCLLQSNDPRLDSKLPSSLGQRTAWWNSAEFLDSNRGI